MTDSPASHDPARTLVAGAPLVRARRRDPAARPRRLGGRHRRPRAAAGRGRSELSSCPQATGHTWYPQRFLAPLEANEPWLSSALGVVGALVDAGAAAGIDDGADCMLLGFSQGACLALELAARDARRYGAVVGSERRPDRPARPGRATIAGAFFGTPVFLGCGDVDAHIPLASVEESAAVLTAHGRAVDMRLYRGMGHTINDDEIEAVRALLDAGAEITAARRRLPSLRCL